MWSVVAGFIECCGCGVFAFVCFAAVELLLVAVSLSNYPELACLFVCLFVRSFVRPFVRSFVPSFVCSFVRSFVGLFVCLFVC